MTTSDTTTLFAAPKRTERQSHRPLHAAPPARKFICGVRKGRFTDVQALVVIEQRGAPGGESFRSWLNAVEGFFATLTKYRLKRGLFRPIIEL
jgi:hypothetical protein